MTNIEDINPDKLRAMLEHAVANLDPRDRAEREAWCAEHDAFGIRMHPSDDDVIEFRWGGAPLVMIRRDHLTGDEPLVGEFIAAVPDTVPDELT